MNDRKILEAIIKAHQQLPNCDLPGLVSDALDRVQQIRTRLADRERRLAEALKGVRAIQLELRAIQKDCIHWATTSHGDASGGSDSYKTCDICGAEIE